MTLTQGYYLVGSDHQDLEQEAVIGIWNAIRSWKPGPDRRALPFVALCVRRHLATCVKIARAQKNESLSFAQRTVINEHGFTEEAVSFIEQHGGDPADVAVLRERLRELGDDVRVQLSPLEARCLLLFANGLSYEQINQIVGLSFKGVDRAITRARWKLRDKPPPSSSRSHRMTDPPLAACLECGARATVGTPRSPRPAVCNVCDLRALGA